ncbi:hypothetical protein ACGVWS_07950 [Enterobacteriaceae bacterium LUAb1]
MNKLLATLLFIITGIKNCYADAEHNIIFINKTNNTVQLQGPRDTAKYLNKNITQGDVSRCMRTWDHPGSGEKIQIPPQGTYKLTIEDKNSGALACLNNVKLNSYLITKNNEQYIVQWGYRSGDNYWETSMCATAADPWAESMHGITTDCGTSELSVQPDYIQKDEWMTINSNQLEKLYDYVRDDTSPSIIMYSIY